MLRKDSSVLAERICCPAPVALYGTNMNHFVSTIELKENTVVVVLGASGDLAKKKTVGDVNVDSTSACC